MPIGTKRRGLLLYTVPEIQMRKIQTCCTVLGACLLAASPQFAQTHARANAPEIPFDSVPNFLKLPPDLYLGEGIGVATNSKGHNFVYTRSQHTRLFEFDVTGKYIGEIGEGL